MSQNRVENGLAFYDKVVDIWYKFLANVRSNAQDIDVLGEAQIAEAMDMLKNVWQIREKFLGNEIWNDVDTKAQQVIPTGAYTTADPESQIGQPASDATMYNRITVSKTSPKGWSDASIGIDILPMVCRRKIQNVVI